MIMRYDSTISWHDANRWSDSHKDFCATLPSGKHSLPLRRSFGNFWLSLMKLRRKSMRNRSTGCFPALMQAPLPHHLRARQSPRERKRKKLRRSPKRLRSLESLPKNDQEGQREEIQEGQVFPWLHWLGLGLFNFGRRSLKKRRQRRLRSKCLWKWRRMTPTKKQRRSWQRMQKRHSWDTN